MELDMSAIDYINELSEIEVSTVTQSKEKNAVDNNGSLIIYYFVIDADLQISGYEDVYI